MLRRALLSLGVLVAVALMPLLVAAQQFGPPQLPPGASIIATGLTNPRGFTWDADGTLYVALAGTGGTEMATVPAPIVEGLGPFFVGPTAAIVRIDDGCPVPIVTGLPSAASAIAGTYGVADLEMLDGRLYALLVGGGEVRARPEWPSGVYAVEDDGTVTLVADLSAWTRANPTEALPWDYDPETGGFDMVADGERLWISQPNRDEVLTVTPEGEIARVVDLSAGHPVLTGIALAPEGGVYVGTLTPMPFADGAAKVLHVSPEGEVRDVWTGLTTVMGIAVAPDGTLYAAEMSTGNTPEPPFLMPGSGRIVRQAEPDRAEEVAAGLTFPYGLAFGPDGALYMSAPAIGANAGEGMIVRLGGEAEATPASGESLTAGHCIGRAATPET